jgi:hypothetical protein
MGELSRKLFKLAKVCSTLTFDEFGKKIPMTRFFNMLLIASGLLLLAGCAAGTFLPTMSTTIAPALVPQLKVGQTRAEVEKITRQSTNPFTYSLRPEVRFQAWPFFEGSDQKCVVVTYDLKEIVIQVEVFVKDRGRFAFPLPAGC